MLRIVSLTTLGIYWIVIFVGTHLPHGVRSLGRIDDKLLHFGAYAGLAFLLAAALVSSRVRRGVLILPLLVAAIYGCVDELSQLAVPGRQADIADWAADVLGAGAGVFAFCVLSRVCTRFFATRQNPEHEAVRKSAA